MAQLLYCSGGGGPSCATGALDEIQSDASLLSAPNTRLVASLRVTPLSWGGVGVEGGVGRWVGGVGGRGRVGGINSSCARGHLLIAPGGAQTWALLRS